MVGPFHGTLPLGGIHQIANWTYASAGARTGAVGLVAADVGKVAWQTDDDTFWVLTDDSPVTWVALAGGASAALAAHLADTSDAHDASAISFTPVGTIAATDAQAAIAEVASEAATATGTVASDLAAHLADATDAHDASAISFVPNGSIASTDVQSAIQEVRDEAAAGGSGDVVGPAASVDSELALFSLTTGKLLKRATLTGIVKAASGVASAATAGTDYYAPGGTDVAIADGGTGASTQSAARTALGLAIGTDVVAPNQDTTGKSAKTDALNSATTVVNVAAATAPTAGQELRATGASAAVWTDDTRAVVIPLGDGTNVISTGVQKLTVECPFAGTITGWAIYGEGSGSIVIDIWKDTYANYPATVADTITASAKPTVTAATKNENNSLGTWSGSPAGSFAAGDHLKFNVDSVTTFTAVTLVLRVKRTA